MMMDLIIQSELEKKIVKMLFLYQYSPIILHGKKWVSLIWLLLDPTSKPVNLLPILILFLDVMETKTEKDIRD